MEIRFLIFQDSLGDSRHMLPVAVLWNRSMHNSRCAESVRLLPCISIIQYFQSLLDRIFYYMLFCILYFYHFLVWNEFVIYFYAIFIYKSFIPYF